MKEQCTLLVMSCDKYETAWFPYFELLKKYWPLHPARIILSTETKQYHHDGLDIRMSNCPPGTQWSDRLLLALDLVQTKYLIFSLEDFFLQAPAAHEKVLECFSYMETHPDVAQCRFKNCDHPEQLQALGEPVMADFYTAGPDVIFRLDTQIALWNTDWFRSFVVPGENPWQFETIGTRRIRDTEARFLWYHAECDPMQTEKLLFPYQMSLASGYGISMGHWLWNNGKLFAENHIDADLEQLGTISRARVNYNLLVNKAVHHRDPRLHYRCFALAYRAVGKVSRTLRSLFSHNSETR